MQETRINFGEPLDLELEKSYEERQSDGFLLYKEIPEGVVVMAVEESARPLVDVLEIPSEINGRKVVGLGWHAFYLDDVFSKIIIPESVIAIHGRALAGTRAIEVSPDNPLFSSESGALFSKDKTELLHFPVDAKFRKGSIPETVKIIGEAAFYQCETLTRVVIPEGVEIIGDSAFERCYSLKTVVIPNGVRKIGECAFVSGRALKRVVIPKGVQEIGVSAFHNDVSTIEIDPENQNFHAESHALFNKDKTKLIGFFPGKDDVPTYCVPRTVKTIGRWAFSDRGSLKKIVLPQGLETIEDYAFACCDALTSITLPDSVKTIGKDAFMFCEKLAHVDMSSSLETIGDGAFFKCFKLKEIIIPNGVQKIGEHAFDCASLEKGVVVIPASVREIGALAFHDTKATLNVDPESEFFVSESGALLNKDKTRLLLFTLKSDLKTYRIPESVREIDPYAFWGEDSLDKIVMPASVEKIGEKAFARGHALIDVDDDNPNYSSESGVLFNKEKTLLIHFPVKSKLQTYVVPDTVKKIADNAFGECRSLISIELPKSVREIDSHAFSGTDVTLRVHDGSYAQWWAQCRREAYETIK